MTEETRQKLAKVYELVNRGEAGERQAAKAALDRLMKKHNLSSEDIESLHLKEYKFKYSNDIEIWLIHTILDYFFQGKDFEMYKDLRGKREIVIKLEYLDFIIVTTSYEYFRRHMMTQYKKVVLPEVKRCRTSKTKKERRERLQNIFFSNYVIASNLYREGDLKSLDTSKMSQKEIDARNKLNGIEGGEYKTQVSTGLYLQS